MEHGELKTSLVPLSRKNIRLRHHFRVRRRHEHQLPMFLRQTVAAQIHAWAAIMSFVALLSLGYLTLSHGWRQVLSASIFGVSAVALFTASAVMHFLSQGYRISNRFVDILENIDKVCINILIAGTYTPIIGLALTDPLRTNMLATVWIFAFLGIAYTVFYKHLPRIFRSRVVYTSQFLMMGWLVLVCIGEIMAALSAKQITWVFTGAGMYSVGAVIYILERPNPTKHFGYHEIWHSFVVLGCASFFMVLFLAYV